MTTEIETRFRVLFEENNGATKAEAGVTRSYNQQQLKEEFNLSIVLDNGQVNGLDNIRRLRDLCDRFLEHNEPMDIKPGQITRTFVPITERTT